MKIKKINFKKLNKILASLNLEKELQYKVKGNINKNGDNVVSATWSIISKRLYKLLNLGETMQTPEWFLSYMNKFEGKLDKKFKIIQNDIDKRFNQVDKRFDQVDKRLDQVDKRLDQIENRLDNVENDIKNIKSDIIAMKMTPTMHKELEKHNN